MGGTVQKIIDFRNPKVGSKYSPIINEGCTAALFGMAYANRYECEIDRAAFEFGFKSGESNIRGDK